MLKLAIVPKEELDPAFENAAKPPETEMFIMQQQRQDSPELAAIKFKQQQMCI